MVIAATCGLIRSFPAPALGDVLGIALVGGGAGSLRAVEGRCRRGRWLRWRGLLAAALPALADLGGVLLMRCLQLDLVVVQSPRTIGFHAICYSKPYTQKFSPNLSCPTL
jgi:hypothetical protein